MRRRGYAAVLAVVLLAGCAGGSQAGMGAGGGPHGMAPAPVPQLDSIPFRSRALYRRMGLMVDSTRMPFVASLRFLATRAPDSTLVIFGLSFANRVLNFRRDAAEFIAAYHIELVLRRDSTFSRTISRDATVRVGTAPETMRRDESVLFQQLVTVPPGIYNVMAVIRDLNSPAYARVDIVDTVPLYSATSLGTPLPLYDGRGRQRIDSQPTVVMNSRAMVRFGIDTMHFYVEGYGLAAGTRLAARVLDADSVVLWTDTLALSGGAVTGAVATAEGAAGAAGKGGKQGRAARPGAEAGAAAAAGARAMFGAGSGADSSIRGGAGGAAGAAAGAGAQGMFGGAAAADADTSVRAAGSARGMLGADGATAAAGDVAAAAGAGAQVGADTRSGVRGVMGAGAAAAAATDSAAGHTPADSAARAKTAVAAVDSFPPGNAPPSGAGGALSAAGIAAGAGALAGAAAISARGMTGINAAADADIGARARTAGARGTGPQLYSLLTAEFVIPPGLLPLGLQSFVVQAVGGGPRTEAPFIVGFSDPWAVKTFPQMISLLRYYPRTDLVAKLRAAPKADRAKAWHDFLKASDPTPNTTQHDSLEAYFLRIDQANRRFLEPAGPGWRTDRGEVYVNLGEADQSYEVPGRKAPGIRWEFTSLKLVLSFADAEGTGQYRLTQQSRIDYERALGTSRNATP